MIAERRRLFFSETGSNLLAGSLANILSSHQLLCSWSEFVIISVTLGHKGHNFTKQVVIGQRDQIC